MKKYRNSALLVLALSTALICNGCQVSMVKKASDSASVEDADDAITNEDGIQIKFSEDSIQTTATSGVSIDGNAVTITAAGTYVLTGSSSDARIEVNVDKEEEVELVLDGLELTCSNYAPIVITQAGEVTIDLAEGSVNRLEDGAEYELTDEDDTTDAVIFSRDDLKLKGDGTLYITANYNHGIVAKDDLTIKGGTYKIQAATDGINANDSITLDGGDFEISAGDDGMHVDEVFTINDATIVITESYEGLEGHQVIINGGTIDITASDDGINSNSGSTDSASEWNPGGEQPEDFSMPENDGELPDGFSMPENDGELPEGFSMPENGGEQPDGMERPDDDGVQPDGMENQDVSDDSGKGFGRGDMNGGMGGKMDGNMGGGMMMDTDADSLIQINGGVITVNASGDGLDSNGQLEINGGTVYVSGATNDGDSAIDYGTQASVNGGILIATGYSGMAERFSEESEQCSFQYGYTDIIKAGTLLSIVNQDGTEIISYEVPKDCNCITASAPEFAIGETYTLYIGEEAVEIELTEVSASLGSSSRTSQQGKGGGGF